MLEVSVEGAAGREGATSGGKDSGGDRFVKFTVPSLPPTVNSLYQIIYAQRRVELRPDCLRWKSDAKRSYIPRFQLREGRLVAVEATFYYRFTYANRKPRVFDAANLLKLLLDAIAERCGFNDMFIRYGSWSSVDSTNERVEVVLREVVNGDGHS
jgi:hypothetical protein